MEDDLMMLGNPTELLEKARPELEAMDPDVIVKRRVSRDRVLELTRVLRTSWVTVASQLEAELHPDRAQQRKQQIARIGDRARVFYAADLRSSELNGNLAKVERDALAVRVAEFDRTLFKWATPLFGDNPTLAEVLRDISRGTGRRDDADDVLRLVKLFRDHWPAAVGKTPVDQVLLDEAEAAAIAQLEWMSDLSNPARDLAARAYSAWHRDYNQLRALGLYLTWDQPDSALRFPGISMPVQRYEYVEDGETDADDGEDSLGADVIDAVADEEQAAELVEA